MEKQNCAFLLVQSWDIYKHICTFVVIYGVYNQWYETVFNNSLKRSLVSEFINRGAEINVWDCDQIRSDQGVWKWTDGSTDGLWLWTRWYLSRELKMLRVLVRAHTTDQQLLDQISSDPTIMWRSSSAKKVSFYILLFKKISIETLVCFSGEKKQKHVFIVFQRWGEASALQSSTLMTSSRVSGRIREPREMRHIG